MKNLIFWFFIGGILFILIYYGIQKLIKYFSKLEEQLKATSFKCLDGHVVRSKGESIIDNYLHKLGLAHKYENTIKIKGEKVKYDWYLTDYDIYIEYWGFFGKAYLKRKQEKIHLYKKGKLKLISVEDIMLADIYTNLEKELGKFIELGELKKYCPNCGNELDNRLF